MKTRKRRINKPRGKKLKIQPNYEDFLEKSYKDYLINISQEFMNSYHELTDKNKRILILDKFCRGLKKCSS